MSISRSDNIHRTTGVSFEQMFELGARYTATSTVSTDAKGAEPVADSRKPSAPRSGPADAAERPPDQGRCANAPKLPAPSSPASQGHRTARPGHRVSPAASRRSSTSSATRSSGAATRRASVRSAKSAGLASTSSVAHQLAMLERKGFLRRDPNRPRAVDVRVPSTTDKREVAPAGPGRHRRRPARCDAPVFVPVVGRIAAGGPILAEQKIEDVFPLPKALVGDGTLFLLQGRRRLDDRRRDLRRRLGRCPAAAATPRTARSSPP